MKLLVKTVDGQTIPINASPQDTVRTLKLKLCDETHISPDVQKLVFTGKVLADHRRLNEYNIVSDTVIHLMQEKRRGEVIRIYVKALTGTVISVDVDPADTVGEVKHKISLKEGIPPDRQQLIFSGKSLDNDHMINSYNIQRDSTVHLVIKMGSESEASSERGDRPYSDTHARRSGEQSQPAFKHSKSMQSDAQGRNNLDTSSQRYDPHPSSSSARSQHDSPYLQRSELFVLTCRTRSGKFVRVNARNTDTVLDLKERIAVQEGIILRQQDIVLYVDDNVELDDRRSVGYYRLTSDRKIRMQLITKKVCTLFIKTLNGKTFILYPPETSIVSEIKAELAEKSGIPATHQRLVYQGQDLADHKTLTQSGAPTQCTLHVIQTNPNPPAPGPSVNPSVAPPSTRPALPLLIKTFTGKAITVFAFHGEPVRSVKENIASKEGYPPDEIVIMLGGKELDDDDVIDHSQIQQGSTLLVTFKAKENLKLTVLDTSRSRVFQLEDVKLTDSISQIEHQISSKSSVPRNAMSLVHNGQVLSKHSSVEDCGITGDSVVCFCLLQPRMFLVTVKTIAGIECSVQITSFQSIQMLKVSVQELLGVPSNEQVLLYKGNCLNDEMYVSDYPLANGSTIHLFTQRGVQRNIVVNIPNVKVLNLHMPIETTVAQLKSVIENDQRLDAKQITVSYNGRELESPYTLGDYVITERAELIATVRSRDVLTVLIQPDNSTRALSFQVDGSDSVRALKLRIAAHLNISVNSIALSYCGVYLLDDRFIRDYNLNNPCVLFAELQSD